jgi:hypothetical protein
MASIFLPSKPILVLRSFSRDKEFVESVGPAPGGILKFSEILLVGDLRRRLSVLKRFIWGRRPFASYVAPHLEEWLGPVAKLDPSLQAFSTEEWQQEVKRLTAVARCVLVLTGNTAGLGWELRFLREHVDPKTVFIALEPEGASRVLWYDVWRFFASADWRLPGADPGAGCILALDEQWNAQVFASNCRSPSDYAWMLRCALLASRSHVRAEVQCVTPWIPPYVHLPWE